MATVIKKLTARQAQEVVIDLIKRGSSARGAMKEVGYSWESYGYWRRSNERFREQTDYLQQMKKAAAKGETIAPEQIPFDVFCRRYLGTELFNHHLQWVDLLEGREPRNLHEAQTYYEGKSDTILINTPPEHAKSTTITINYVTYRICMDPNIRIIIVSKTQEMAKRFLRAVKDRLSGNNQAYTKLQMDFAPEGGFNANSAAWTADSIYISSDLRDSGEPSPTVQALGIKGQIYGSRADLILMDDCVDSGNAHEFAKHIDWIQNEVSSRIAYPGGRLLLIGTRLASVDLYSEIQKPEYYGDEVSPWTYLTQPAVLEYADNPEDWVTLWPRTNRPPVSMSARGMVEADENGLFPMWPGEALHRKRSKMSPKNWSMVYMQAQVQEDSIFNTKAVVGSIDGMRPAGPMARGAPGHRKSGMDGLYVIGGFDPALTGHSAAVVMGVDRDTGERWILDVWTKGNLKPVDIFDKIKDFTIKYKIHEWRIEKNAMNLMVTQDEDIKRFLAQRGCLLKEHFTGKNKWDTDFGVASMSSLFDGWENKKQLIHLPSRSEAEGVKALIEQLCTWTPDTKAKTDCVMALWFAEIRARELANEVSNVFHMNNSFASPRDKEREMTVDLDYMSTRQFGGGDWMTL